MENYIRKIVHMDVLKKEYGIKGQSILGYYKLEMRHNRTKIALSMDGLKALDVGHYVICMILKEDQSLTVKEFKALELLPNGRINESFLLEEAQSLRGLMLIHKYKNTINHYKDYVIMIGNESEPIPLEALENEKHTLVTKQISGISPAFSERPDLNFEQMNKPNKVEPNIVPPNKVEINKETIQSDFFESTVLKETIKSKSTSKNNKGARRGAKESKKNANVPLEPKLNPLEYIKEQLEKKDANGYFDELFTKNPLIVPFEREDPNTAWVKIEITDLVFLPLEAWMLINNAFLMGCYKKYKHLILGKNTGESLLKLGVPDVYYLKESILANICGFHEFVSSKEGHSKPGDFGYWIVKSPM